MFLSQSACYIVRGGALGIHQGRATHVPVLWCCMWGTPLGDRLHFVMEFVRARDEKQIVMIRVRPSIYL